MIPKFRAWYKNGTLPMLMVSSISFDHKFLDVYIDEAFKLETEITIDFDDVVLMQSTGLFDKNGVEIFEGDVLKCCITKEPENYWFEAVFWNSGKAWFESKDKNHVEPFDNLVNDKHITCEVIGNIYENPELVAK